MKQITDACVSAVDKSEFVIDGVDVNNVGLLFLFFFFVSKLFVSGFILNFSCLQVTLVGMVREKIGRITDVAFFLDDGTGRIECNKW